MTPHINAKKEDIAKLVLMPGDPLRAKFIAETYLENAKKINGVRNMFMYTGTYKGKKISICGSGMGHGSIGIYAYELYSFYEVEKIVRIGSAGSYKKDLKIYDVVLVEDSYSDSTEFDLLILGGESHISKPAKELNDEIIEIAKQKKLDLTLARAHSTNVFYASRPLEETIKVSGADCVEMESTALFTVAKKLNKKAATLLTISDNLITKEVTSPEERQKKFTKMMEVALEIGV